MRFIALTTILLAGCSTLGPSINQSYAAIQSYEGRPLSEVIERIGYPDREEAVAGKSVYFWGEDREAGASCVWKVVADEAGTVIDTAVTGNIYGCERQTKMLSRL